MKDSSSLHQKIQDHCDCYMTTDPLKEMSKLPGDTNTEDAAVKWLALAALHGINNNAEKITISRHVDGTTRVVAEYRDTELPSPGVEICNGVIEAVRSITHIEGDKGKMALALGVRDSSVDLRVKIKKKGDIERVKIEFPEN
jgi:hypothetical protein